MLENKSLGAADSVIRFGRGRVEVVELPGVVFSRAILEPGWRWSLDARPVAGTVSCQSAHQGYVVAGRFHVRMDDGSEREFGPGDAHVVSPGHDAWVVGNERAVIVDFTLSMEGSETTVTRQGPQQNTVQATTTEDEMTETATYQTETSDMLIPHNLFRSVFRTADQLIAGVPDGDAAKVDAVSSYFDNILRFLDAHHGGEDVCVWPLLSARCPQAAELLERMEREHETIHRLRGSAGDALSAWNISADAAGGRRFGEALRRLGSEVDTHFAEEEAEILPLASRTLSPEEWGAMPGHAMASFTGDKIWLVLGLIFEQMNDEQLSFTFSLLPPPVVEMWNTSGRAAFNEFIGRVRQAA